MDYARDGLTRWRLAELWLLGSLRVVHISRCSIQTVCKQTVDAKNARPALGSFRQFSLTDVARSRPHDTCTRTPHPPAIQRTSPSTEVLRAARSFRATSNSFLFFVCPSRLRGL